MKTIDKLRVICGKKIIKEFDTTKENKLLLLGFIQHEANEQQLKALYLDRVFYETIHEDQKSDLDKRFRSL